MVDVLEAKSRRPLLNPNTTHQPEVTAAGTPGTRMAQLQVEQAHAHTSLTKALVNVGPLLEASEDPAAASVLADLEATTALLEAGGGVGALEAGTSTYSSSLALLVPTLAADDLAALNSVTTSMIFISSNMRVDDVLPALDLEDAGEAGAGGSGGSGGTPAVVDTPYASQVGTNLECTMGNWTNTPTSYTYQWFLDGTPGAAPSPTSTRVIDPGDIGQTATCVVAATNATGTTQAPPSNSVVIA